MPSRAAGAGKYAWMAEDDSASQDALAAAAERLYAAAPADFMATRAELVAQARAAKDRPLAAQIGKLRKPSVAANLLNALVRARPDLVQEVHSLGAKLRAAQANLHGTAITALRPDRDALIAAVLSAAGEVAQAAGTGLSGAAETEIRESVIAALASAEATDAVTSGALTRALSYAGFGEVDLENAVVATATGRLLRVLPSPVLDAPEPAEEADQDSADEPAQPAAEGIADEHPADPGDESPSASSRNEPPSAEAADDRDSGLDHDALIEQAAAAYQDAAGRVAAAKSAVREASARLDTAKERIAELRRELAAAEDEIEPLFAADASAREAVATAVRERQIAAELLARREAAADEP